MEPTARLKHAWPALSLTGLLAAFMALPLVRGSPGLLIAIATAVCALLAWCLCLIAVPARGLRFGVLPRYVSAHSTQACVQLCIYAYWAWHWPAVRAEAPLILAQIVFLYNFEALLAWSRGRPWNVGFGPLPIVFSTNLLFWFRHDVYLLQFLLVATGALGKEFVRWRRDGRSSHIFNPSVFGQSIFALVLIATGTTTQLSMGSEIAASFEQLPHIFALLFVLGLVVQYRFSVTLVTLSAVAALCVLNIVYTAAMGSYYFATINVGATVFLGAHLLITDPSTSPRGNIGRVMFGALYGLGYAVLFRLFDEAGTPLFWDKLLPVPILNLMVPWLDRIGRRGLVSRLNRLWDNALSPRRMNLAHMAIWSALFVAVVSTGFVGGEHEGQSITFWRRAYENGAARSGHNLRLLSTVRAGQGDAEACNMLGKLYLEGDLVPRSDAAAAHWFAKACALGWVVGCENVAGQYLFRHHAESPDEVARAFDALDLVCAEAPNANACFLAGLAYELGSGRRHDLGRAIGLYKLGSKLGGADARKALARLSARGISPTNGPQHAASR